MHKHALSILWIFLLFSIFSVSCKTTKGNSNENAEVIFSLNTTSCFGECPVYELTLYGNKELVFEGKQHTDLKGVHRKKLTDGQFEAFLGIIESTDWNKLQSSYTSNMSDLPTQNFVYNRKGINKSVSKYGNEPKELNKMLGLISAFVEEQVFADQ